MNPYIYTGVPKLIQQRFRQSLEKLTVESFMKKSIEYLGFTEEQLKSPSRKKELAISRHMICYAMKLLFKDLSLKTIGQMFNRDHSTVINSIKCVNNMKDTDANFSESLDRYLQSL